MARVRYGYRLHPQHPLRARLGQGPPPQPDPSASVLPTVYGGPYKSFFPLLRPSGSYGIVSEPTSARPPSGGGVGAPTLPGAEPQAVPNSELDPWLFPPLDVFPFIIQPPAPVGPLAAGSSAIVMTLLQLPRGRMACFQRFGNSASDMSSLVTWTFLIRGQPTAPIINFWGQYGLVTDPRPLPGAGVILQSGDDFQLRVTNGTGAPITALIALISGFSWAVPA
jgi:hypothetical protein